MINPDSFEESSCQARLIWLVETADAERFEGAVGRAGLAACTSAVNIELRAAINRIMRTRTDALAYRSEQRFKALFDVSRRWFITSERYFQEHEVGSLRKTTRSRHFPSAAGVRSTARRTTWSSINNAFSCLVIFF